MDGSGLALVRLEPDVCEVATAAASAISTRHGLSSLRQTAAIALRIPPRKRHSSSILIESNRSAQDDCGGVRLGWLGLGAREARAGRVRGRYTRVWHYLDASRLVKPPTDCCNRAQISRYAWYCRSHGARSEVPGGARRRSVELRARDDRARSTQAHCIHPAH